MVLWLAVLRVIMRTLDPVFCSKNWLRRREIYHLLEGVEVN